MACLIVLASATIGHGYWAPERLSTEHAQPSITHVWVIVEENHDWSDVAGNADFPYINALLKFGAHAENYHNVPIGQTLHPSEPNYLVLEAGDSLGFLGNDPPSAANSSTTADHLVAYLEKAGRRWRSYQEGISGQECPLTATGLYAPKHNPMIFFQDVTDGNDPASATCIAHIRPFAEMADDLAENDVADYTFITPDLCNDMHEQGCDTQADGWLAREIPAILDSAAYQAGGVIFITWDEGVQGNEPIGLIVLSSLAKPGYVNDLEYCHASLVRTIQDIFDLQPYLREANNVKGLSDLFVPGALSD